MRMSLCRRVMFVLVSVAVSGCLTAWHPVPAATVEQGDTRMYKRLMIITRDGYEVQITNASIRGDSVVGTSTGASAGEHVAFSHEQVVRIESQEPDIAPAKEEARSFMAAMGQGLGRIFGCFFSLGHIC